MTTTIRFAFAVALAASVTTLAQQPDRSHAPSPGPAKALELPAIQKRQLANGLPVTIVERHQVPVAQVTLLLFSGSSDEPAGRYGIANMTAAMLEQGAGTRSALEVADAIDFLGADLAAASGTDSMVVRLHAPVTRLSDALPIMADVVLRPTFPQQELDRQRRQRLTSILQARDSPETVSSVAFQRELYGPAHRYGTPQFGTAQTVASFTTDDVRAFYGSVFRPDNAALLVVGDVAPDRVLSLLDAQFGSWKAPAGPITHVKLPPTPQPAKRQVYFIDKPGAAQSQIRIGWVGVPRSTPDYFPIQVMNTILGGSFSSRLNLNLREKHGYAYGASSAFDMRLGAGPFLAAAGVQTDKTADALKEFFVELNGIRQPVPADELLRAKNFVSLRFPAGFETSSDISRRLEDQMLFHLPDDYFAKYVQNIDAVTEADVHRVAQTSLDPSRFLVVVSGDLKTIEPAVKALNLGVVKVLTVDDVFGPAPAQ